MSAFRRFWNVMAYQHFFSTSWCGSALSPRATCFCLWTPAFLSFFQQSFSNGSVLALRTCMQCWSPVRFLCQWNNLTFSKLSNLLPNVKSNLKKKTSQRWWKSDWLCSSCFRCSWSSWPSPSGVDRSSSTQRISSGTTIWMVPANRGRNCTMVWPFQSWKFILNSLW